MTDLQLSQQLLGLEHEYWQAIKDRDAEAAMRLSADPCILAGAQGTSSIPREALGQMISSANYRLREFSLGDDAKVEMLSDDVAVVAYDVHEELTVEGKRVVLDATETSTWVRRGGSWECALHTESIAGDPFGRDRTSMNGKSSNGKPSKSSGSKSSGSKSSGSKSSRSSKSHS